METETFEKAKDKIFAELTSDDSEVRKEYLKLFDPDVKKFSAAMAKAYITWKSLDADLRGEHDRAYVSALVYSAINIHILSLKLFLSGHIVSAGNLFRQAIEFIALAFVCSRRDLGILERFKKDQYSTNDAVRDVLRYSKKLGLNKQGVRSLKLAQKFYSQYSHPTLLTIATFASFSQGGLYIGANFDDGKIEGYRKEIDGRIQLARVFPNFVDGVIVNIAKW